MRAYPASLHFRHNAACAALAAATGGGGVQLPRGNGRRLHRPPLPLKQLVTWVREDPTDGAGASSSPRGSPLPRPPRKAAQSGAGRPLEADPNWGGAIAALKIAEEERQARAAPSALDSMFAPIKAPPTRRRARASPQRCSPRSSPPVPSPRTAAQSERTEAAAPSMVVEGD
eukprot:SAG11_NODE_12444_length_703_cov_0.951987_2_plen_171_part_01